MDAKASQVSKVVISCNKCGRAAAEIELIPKEMLNDKRTALRVRGFLGETTKWGLGSGEFTDQDFDKIQTLAENNLKELHSLDPDAFGFICRECGVAYCRKCWSSIYDTSDEGFYDDTRGTCPKGHEQMLSD